MCFFCEGELAGRGAQEGKAADGAEVAIAVCPDCVGSLGTLLADATSELEPGMGPAPWLAHALEKVEGAAWQALALHLDGGREAAV